MKPEDVIRLLKEAKVDEALSSVDLVEDKHEMAIKLTEFAGTLNYLKGKPVLSEVLLNKSLSLWDKYAPTHYNLGVLYSSPEMLRQDEAGYLNLAENEFRAALDIEPDFHQARYNLALLIYFEGRTEEARSEYERIGAKLGDDPSFRELGVLLAQALRVGR
jgi:tetratricopeptide (TPR) repeat protein